MAKKEIGRTITQLQNAVKLYLEDATTTIQSLNLGSLSMTGNLDMNDNNINNTNTVNSDSVSAGKVNINGNEIYVQPTKPTNASDGDIWLNNS